MEKKLETICVVPKIMMLRGLGCRFPKIKGTFSLGVPVIPKGPCRYMVYTWALK